MTETTLTASNEAENPSPIARLLAVMAQLRDKESGCPWDVEQDHHSIARYAIEEAYEVVEAIEKNDVRELKEELGDLLLQVVFHAQMADERGDFNFDDVANAISEKMIRRHPHVFGEVTVANGEDVHANWETIKAEERQEKQGDKEQDANSILDDIPLAFPALMRSQKLQSRAARVGFDWPEISPVIAKIREELDELERAESDAERLDEMGDVLFACSNLARHLSVDAEEALRHTNAKFERRFRHIEHSLASENRALESASLEEMESFWQAAKASEK